jgi:hypothetical protein
MPSTGLGPDEAPMDGYPVDGIKDKTPCELHQSMRNISMKVAVDYALYCEPKVTWHSHQIPVGYARVGVDEIVPVYDSLELDMTGPEDEVTLREFKGGVILWNKKYISFQAWRHHHCHRVVTGHHHLQVYSVTTTTTTARVYLDLCRRISRHHHRLRALSFRAKSRSVPPRVLRATLADPPFLNLQN